MMYPIAEIFHSVQGEGFWTGTPMMFVRLAGCNVGQYVGEDMRNKQSAFSADFTAELSLLREKKHSICTTFDGQRFICDTDYHRAFNANTAALVNNLKDEQHVCITGGEPFLHDLSELVFAFQNAGCSVHIETSGTKPLTLRGIHNRSMVWITCCPKIDLSLGEDDLLAVDEWKVLVGPEFNLEAFEELVNRVPFKNRHRIYLQPINGVETVNKTNLQACQELLMRYPFCKLSVQLHKFLGVR